MIIAAAVLIAIFIIVTAIRTWGAERPLLYVLIPVLLIFSAYSGYAINEMRGYATYNLGQLENPFVYIAHTGKDPVFLLAIPQGADEPRLFAIPGDQLSEKDRRGLTESGAKTDKQIRMMGRFSEGEYQSYEYDVTNLPPKEN